MEKTEITELLMELYPMECEVVGPTNLQDIVDTDVGFVAPEFASSLDLSDTISILVVAVTFIKSVLDIYSALKKELKRNPRLEEIEIKLIVPKDITQNLDEKTRRKLIATIIKKLM